MAGWRRRIRQASFRHTRGIRSWRALTPKGRRTAFRVEVKKLVTGLSPGTARTGRRIATRYARQRSALRHIK